MANTTQSIVTALCRDGNYIGAYPTKPAPGDDPRDWIMISGACESCFKFAPSVTN